MQAVKSKFHTGSWPLPDALSIPKAKSIVAGK